MKAMILAAGRGERMKPLTDTCPKPLLKVQGRALIEHHICNLAKAGITDLVINHAWLGQQIEDYLSDGKRWQVNITYSKESQGALETAGGIINALPLLGDRVFLVVNGDIFTSFDFSQLPALSDQHLAHLCLVNNPEHNHQGDFSIVDGLLQNLSAEQQQTYTYSGIGLFRPEFFQLLSQKQRQQGAVQRLAPLLRKAADMAKVGASVISNDWVDVGTPDRLAKINRDFNQF
jgi:MurNAc alpha-1-phosphate uridylyltransferase